MASSGVVDPQPESPTPLPDERFWVRYSPNQELPLSSLTSLAIHALAILFLVGLVMIATGTQDRSMPVESLALDGDGLAGGGGDPNADVVNSNKASFVERAVNDDLPVAARPDALTPLPEVRESIDLDVKPNADRTVPSTDQAKKSLGKIGNEPSTGPQSKGRGGPGAGGGKGPGVGKGDGHGTGPAAGSSVRAKRNRRWTLTFDRADGHDYLRQLHALGAQLVAEFPDKSRLMYRNLNESPVPGEPVDPKIQQHMVWYDERPGAVGELAGAMRLPQVPKSFRAYFPFELEDELLRLELAFRNKQEQDIESTNFRVFLPPTGRYRLVVSEQKYLR